MKRLHHLVRSPQKWTGYGLAAPPAVEATTVATEAPEVTAASNPSTVAQRSQCWGGAVSKERSEKETAGSVMDA